MPASMAWARKKDRVTKFLEEQISRLDDNEYLRVLDEVGSYCEDGAECRRHELGLDPGEYPS